MAGLCNLIVAVALVCFAASVEGVTDRQFQELSNLVRRLQDENQRQFSELENKIAEQDLLIERLLVDRRDEAILKGAAEPLDAELAQNMTIEERVALLEIQVVEIEEDIALLVENDDFLFDQQVIQDERLFSLETETEQIEEELESVQALTIELDNRVSVLEENGGSDGNSSISELEERVETLEGTAADHEARITTSEAEIEDLEGTTDDHEARLTAAEENIQGLQMTDISLDARIAALEDEESGNNETIAFDAYISDYDTIAIGSAVEFNEVLLNEGNGYNNSTGVFTVPPAGDGLYYFSTYLRGDSYEYGFFNIEVNGVPVCTAAFDLTGLTGDGDGVQGTCTALVYCLEGDDVNVMYDSGTDDTPLWSPLVYLYHGFVGFRM